MLFRSRVMVVRGIEKEDGPILNGGGAYVQQMGDEEMSRVWIDAVKSARVKLDMALDLSTNADLSSRLDSRIAILKDEITTKLEILGIQA